MNRRYTYKNWQVGEDVAWDDLNWDEYGKRKYGIITRIWNQLGIVWVHENNGFNHSVETFRLVEPDFP